MKHSSLFLSLLMTCLLLTGCNKNANSLSSDEIILDSIEYGIYPQSNVVDYSTLIGLNNLTYPEANGWYLYKNEYYAKAVASDINDGAKFDDGTTINKGKTYWFKCEPIVWNVLKQGKQSYLLSKKVLDLQRFSQYYDGTSRRTDYQGESANVYANNYKYSEIRTWLNTTFYDKAFCLDKTKIVNNLVDNSASTTDEPSYLYACPDTNDNVFLPSYKDLMNSEYGFEESEGISKTRESLTTDYARTIGVSMSDSSANKYSGAYWTRSQCSTYFTANWAVVAPGKLFYTYNCVGYSEGVRPAIIYRF